MLFRSLARVREEIQRAGGAIGFDRYMAIALYEPGLGYYASGRRKFGALGDFVTAPELTPLFGACVAAQLSHWLPDLVPCVWEFGAGSGALAAQVLQALEQVLRPPTASPPSLHPLHNLLLPCPPLASVSPLSSVSWIVWANRVSLARSALSALMVLVATMLP